MATINTNMAANIASNALTRNERSMSATMERLSTGLRINSAKDDAAGLAISSKMTSQVRGLNQAVRNANDAISMIQVAEGAMKEVTNMFQRMRELAIQAISDSNTSADRVALNNEYKQLSAEVMRVAENTQWNGTNILDGTRTSTTYQVGANAGQTVAVNFGDLGTDRVTAGTPTLVASKDGTGETKVVPTATIDFTGTLKEDDIISFKTDAGNFITIKLSSAQATTLNGSATSDDISTFSTTTSNEQGKVQGTLTGTTAGTLAGVSVVDGALVVTGPASPSADDLNITLTDITVSRGTHAPVAATDITTSTLANSALTVLGTAIDGVNSTRAGLGASMSRLEYASDNLHNVAQNTSAARSRILDADYAAETTELARTQIIQQAATAMLAQANQSQQSVLALLRQ